jgi:hypothetical protein
MPKIGNYEKKHVISQIPTFRKKNFYLKEINNLCQNLQNFNQNIIATVEGNQIQTLTLSN